MTTLAARAPSAISSLLHKLAHEMCSFAEGFREARAIAARYEALSRLSDAELARRGLTRADIAQAAFNPRR